MSSIVPPLPLVQEYDVRVAAGRVPGTAALRKFGYNGAIGVTETYVGIVGGAAPYLPTAATAVRIKAGGSANDTAAGTGAQEVYVDGLDANFEPATALIVTAGASASAPTSQTFIRVFRCYVTKVGTYGGSNAAAIVIETTGGTAWTTIALGAGQTQGSAYCVPAGKSLLVSEIHLSSLSTKPVSFSLWKIEGANDVTTPFAAKRIVQQYPGIEGTSDTTYTPPIRFPAYTDVWVTGIVTSTTGGGSVEFNGYLVDNDS